MPRLQPPGRLEELPECDVAALRDIGAQHDITVAQGYQTTVELMDASSKVKYGDNY